MLTVSVYFPLYVLAKTCCEFNEGDVIVLWRIAVPEHKERYRADGILQQRPRGLGKSSEEAKSRSLVIETNQLKSVVVHDVVSCF